MWQEENNEYVVPDKINEQKLILLGSDQFLCRIAHRQGTLLLSPCADATAAPLCYPLRRAELINRTRAADIGQYWDWG